MSHKQKIIVLRTTRFGESDLIVSSLNQQGARLTAIAKGALKSQKRFGGGVLEPTHFIEVVLKPKKRAHAQSGNRLEMIYEARLLNGFSGLRANLQRIETAMHFLSLSLRFSQEGTTDAPEMFNLLGNSLLALERSDQPELLRVHFELKALSLQGVLPPLAAAQELLQTSILAHANLKTSSQQWLELQRESRVILQSYLDL